MAKESLTTEIVLKLVDEVIVKNFNALLLKVYDKGSKYYDEFKILSGTGLKAYYASVIDKYLYVKTIIDSRTRIPLYDAFVPINLQQNRKTINTEEIKKLFECNNHFIISGLAGAGKTTLTKYLFIESIRRNIKIPLMIELRNLKYTGTLEEGICDYLKTFNLNISSSLLESLLQKGLFTVFFDGLDEMQIVLQKTFSCDLQRFRDKYHLNNIVIISRPIELIRSYENFEVFDIKKLELEQAILLINKLPYDEEVKEHFVDILSSKLYVKNKSFAQNPLLLTIMLMTYDHNADIPDRLTEFYQMAYGALYQHHDAMKGGSFHRETHCHFNIIEFEKILSCFCYYTLYQGLITMSYEEVIENLAKTKVYYPEYTFDEADFFRDLVQCVCIIIQEGFNYQFVHRSFQEYFCAKFIANTIAEEKVETVLKKFSQKMNLREMFKMINEIKPIYLERYYFLPIIKYTQTLISESSSLASFVGKHVITMLAFSFEEGNRISFFGSNGDYFLLGDLMYIVDYYKIKKNLLDISNREIVETKKYKLKLSKKDNNYTLKGNDAYYQDFFNLHMSSLKSFLEVDLNRIKKKIEETIANQDKFIDELLI